MTPSTTDPKIRQLARDLGVDPRGDCWKKLEDHALGKVREITKRLTAKSSDTLLQLVAGMVSLRVLFVRDDGDIEKYAQKYGDRWPLLAPQLREDFLEGDTLGLVMTHPSPKRAQHRNFAFIDARGDRSNQAYFTAWHEIAHLLLEPQQLSLSGLRRVSPVMTEEKAPIESLVDRVAGKLAFYEPFVKPALDAELARTELLTLDGISRVRDEVAPEASFSAAAHALVRMMDAPMAFVVAKMRLKPTQARKLKSSQLAFLDDAAPKKKLRVASAFPNEHAKSTKWKIFKHMRVPPESAIMDVYRETVSGTVVQEEDQQLWETGGNYLPQLRLRVEAQKFGDVVYSLIRCHPAE